MTDQDRGAYTPQTDAPLAFDARYSKGSGERPAPTALILSGVVLIALVAALAFFYRHGFRDSNQPAQVVGAPATATKAPPSGQVAAADTAAGVQILKTEAVPAGEGGAHTVTTVAPPESVAPRPVAATPVDQAQLRPAQPQAAPAVAVAAKPVVAKAAPVAALPLTASAAAPITGTPKPVKLAKAAPAPKPATTTATTKAAKGVDAEIPTGAPVAQIGAFSSAALAQKGWADDAALMPGQMAGKSRKVEMAEVNGKTYYRSFVGGFASKEAAAAFCASLSAAGRNCIVK